MPGVLLLKEEPSRLTDITVKDNLCDIKEVIYNLTNEIKNL